MDCSTSLSCIPRCAVELLFAEDLVDRIMRRHTGRQFEAWRAAPYRDFILNAFSDDIARAVDFIDMMLEWEMDETFSRMVDEHRVDRESFVHYALHFKELCFEQGFDADNFLVYSVRLVSLAAYFAQYGKPLALELALFFVMKVLTDYDLFEGGWDTLNAMAKKYVERKKDFGNVLTPGVSDDDEPSMNALEDDEEDDEYYVQDGSFAVDEEEKPKDETVRQKLDFSGLDLPASYENETEDYISSEDDERAITEEKPRDKPDHKRMNMSRSKLNLPDSTENEAGGYISKGEDESAIIQEKMSQDKPDQERMDLSGSKLDLPDCPESKGKIKIGIPLKM